MTHDRADSETFAARWDATGLAATTSLGLRETIRRDPRGAIPGAPTAAWPRSTGGIGEAATVLTLTALLWAWMRKPRGGP